MSGFICFWCTYCPAFCSLFNLMVIACFWLVFVSIWILVQFCAFLLWICVHCTGVLSFLNVCIKHTSVSQVVFFPFLFLACLFEEIIYYFLLLFQSFIYFWLCVSYVTWQSKWDVSHNYLDNFMPTYCSLAIHLFILNIFVLDYL